MSGIPQGLSFRTWLSHGARPAGAWYHNTCPSVLPVRAGQFGNLFGPSSYTSFCTLTLWQSYLSEMDRGVLAVPTPAPTRQKPGARVPPSLSRLWALQ